MALGVEHGCCCRQVLLGTWCRGTAFAACVLALIGTVHGGDTSYWTDVASDVVAGQGHENHRGAAWGDFNNDGLLDLYVTHFGLFNAAEGEYWGSENQLLQNMGNGSFIEVTTDALAIPGGLSHHPVWGDTNNDGLLDLYVGQSSNFGTDSCRYLVQESPGIYTDLTNGDPLGMLGVLCRAVTWQDVNNDGLLDLYVSNSGGDSRRNRLMINMGDGTFDRVYTLLDQVEVEGRGLAWCDFDNDGLPDVYASAGSEELCPVSQRTNSLFRNLGGGEWEDVAVIAGVDDIAHARGVAWGDFNNDGFMDLVIGNQVGSDYPGYNRLYRNEGDGTFTDIAASAGIAENVRTRCISFADYDNDGFLDIYVVNFGSLNPPNRLYRNNGDETFTDVAIGTQVAAPYNGSAAAWGDFDNDGWIDLYTVGGSWTIPGVGMNRLCRNENQNGNHWIEIEFCSMTSNRLAIGARVSIVHVSGTGEDVRQVREIQSGSGYNSQQMLRAHFGLGDSESVSVEIRWPSGAVHSFGPVSSNQIMRVVEAEDGAAWDCNRNCIDDALDILYEMSMDCNGNGIPDECDPDCDGDGIPDDCDDFEDCNGNGIPDNCDLDCNGNGIPDACESFADCNGNGIPDACDIDCDGNGIPDDCDAIEDCNGNGVPDECENLVDCNANGIADDCENFTDCNGNGYPDECDILDGSSGDCNDNLVPDECDIESGELEDSDGDGTPDICECPMDGDNDGIVGFTDVVWILNQWGPCNIEHDPCENWDFDGDGDVGFNDLMMVLNAWGACPG